jgi:hypothetical protein
LAKPEFMIGDFGPRDVCLDHHAYLERGGANSHSSSHKAGWRAAKAVDWRRHTTPADVEFALERPAKCLPKSVPV